MTSIIPLSSLLDFLGADATLQIKKGENLLKSNHLEGFTYDPVHQLIAGNVRDSQRQLVYKPKMTIRGQKISDATCDCVRGQLTCGHMACVLIYAQKNVSVTDTTCIWAKRSGREENPTDNIEAIYPKPAKAVTYELFAALDYDSVFRTLQQDLQECGKAGTGVLFLLEKESPRISPEQTVADLGLPDMQEILTSSACRQAHDVLAFLRSNLALSWGVIERVADATVSQTDNSSWSLVRKLRLTASNFGEILKFMDRSVKKNCTPAPSLMKRLMRPASLIGVKAVMWGRDHERRAITHFENQYKVKVKPSGIWLHESGVLGASPDGLVDATDTVEVKCPYKWRSSHDLTKDLTPNAGYIVSYSEEKWQLHQQHEYYHQIQGQLFFSRRNFCNFIIWAEKCMYCCRIPFNKNWAVENIPKLLRFYSDYYVPYVWANLTN